jgi:hypothetical protein
MTYRTFSHRRALIADRLNIRPEDVSTDQVLAYDAGEMEPAEACDWPRLPAASISSGPYRVPLANSVPVYTIWPVPGGAFPDDAPFPDFDDWPGPPNTLLTEGSGGNG